MKNLLTDTYPKEKGNPDAKCSIEFVDGDFSLSDQKACDECKMSLQRYPTGCNEIGMKIHADSHLCVLRFDSYIEQFYQGQIPSNCDYLIFDDNDDVQKFAFCDLSCSTRENIEPNSGKYPEGKRAKCRTQMQSSLDHLAQDVLLASRMYSIPHRVALFGWREYKMKSIGNAVADSMQHFVRTPSSAAGILEYEAMALTGNFRFIEVKYPAVYQWTEPRQDIATYATDRIITIQDEI